MAATSFKGNPINTTGDLPDTGTTAPDFLLTKTDLSDCRLEDFKGQTLVLNIFPSIDTPVCASSVRRFNQEASGLDNTVVLCISADLPFAHNRFCETEGLKDVVPASVFRSPNFGQDYGLTIENGPIAGLLARAILVVDPSGQVVHSQLVPDIAQEPDYDAALAALKS
ncbi:MAG: thiol peroxidase [Desulfobacteraceae bacterium]|nr:MAG: thiol peroxidase [Desulfobacteraceae bacterium]